MKYILKKDLPFAKAGERVDVNAEGDEYITVRKKDVKIDCPLCDIPKEDFDNWIEEVKPREWWILDVKNPTCLYSEEEKKSWLSKKFIKVREVIE